MVVKKPWQYLPHRWLAAASAYRRALPARRRHAAARQHLSDVAADISANCLTGVTSLEKWEQQRSALRQQLAWMLGLDPLPERTPLDARITGKLEWHGCRIEKVVFESLPGLYVTGNFYVPTQVSGPLPCLLYLCGHMHHPLGAKVLYHHRAMMYARAGFACLAVDPVELGEVPGIHHGTHCLGYWHWLSLGYTPAGVEVWNGMRALDWLQNRVEVKSDGFGVTGISGGGVMSWFLAALDDRIAAATPTCASYTIGSQVCAELLPWQCDCVFYTNIFQLDFPVVSALVAPRPVLILSGLKDPVFPPAGYRDLFIRVRRIYALYGHEERIAMVDSGAGHDDTALTLRESRAWLARWLQARRLPTPADASTIGVPLEQLACLRTPPARALNYSIHDQFIRKTPAPAAEVLAHWESRQQFLDQSLRETVFRWMPEGRSIAFQTECRESKDACLSRFGHVEDCSIETEPGVRVRLLLILPRDAPTRSPLVVVVRTMSGWKHSVDIYDLLPLLGRAVVILCYPRFSELPLSATEQTDLERASGLLGRSRATMQTWDTLRVVRWALDERKLGDSYAAVTGRGVGALTAMYTAILEKRLCHTILEEAASTHWQGPPFPCILRVTDVPEAAGLLAPRRLTLIRECKASFETTRGIYEAVGAGTEFTVAHSLAEAVFLAGAEIKSGRQIAAACCS